MSEIKDHKLEGLLVFFMNQKQSTPAKSPELQWEGGAGAVVVDRWGSPYFRKVLFQGHGLILCIEDSHINESL